jgi:hypothetical protein
MKHQVPMETQTNAPIIGVWKWSVKDINCGLPISLLKPLNQK